MKIVRQFAFPLVTVAGLAFFNLNVAGAQAERDTIALAGQWRFELDREDVGLEARWFERTLPDKIKLPGSLPAQGIGEDVTVNTKWTGGIVDRSWYTAPEYAKYRQHGNVKVPFWLQPEKYYVGAAWYQRDIEIRDSWKGKRIVLSLERPHWETRVWVDRKIIGTNNALATPHDHDLGQLPPGRHTLTIRVDSRMVVDVGQDSHSVSDHTQGNWNGIVGRIELRATPLVWIEDLQVYPHITTKSVTVRGKIGSATGKVGNGKVMLFVEAGAVGRVDGSIPLTPSLSPRERETRPLRSEESERAASGAEREAILPLPKGEGRGEGERIAPLSVDASWEVGGGLFETELALDSNPQLWDEFVPALLRLTASLNDNQDTRKITFGLREISTQGTQFLINGRKTFFRGTLDCCIFPKTGHPPTDVAEWKRIIGVAKAHGLNLIRFHSWCPPEAAFVAADELGFYFHVECSSWANSSTTLGDGKPIDSWIYEEADRILKYYGNHPSFILMPYGNEPGGAHHAQFLAKWVDHYKALDPRRLWTSGAGWPQIPENQWHSTPDPRIQAWGGGLKSRINARPPETRTDYRDYIRARTVPVISHEIGQWCVYPNFDEIKKYTGYLKPKNFDIFRDTLNAHHLGAFARPFLLASGKLQTLCYKEDIESALRTPAMGGFELLDLHDFPGQGTALVGVLDPFWEEKGYVTAKEFSRFCNSTVPLARLSKRVFTTDEKLEADLEVAHFGSMPLENAVTNWKLVSDGGKILARGELPSQSVPVNNGIALGRVSVELKNFPAPTHCKFVVRLEGPGSAAASAAPVGALADRNGADTARADVLGEGAQHGTRGRVRSPTRFANDWDLWVYPPPADTQAPEGVTIVDELNEQALTTLNAGGKVLLLIPPERVKGDNLGKVALGFSIIFWNTAWTHRQPPHTLGILCDPKHPALAEFPTEFHSNWQWWYLVSRAGAMILDDLPPKLRPTVQVIDDWFTARKLGLVFEAKLRAGKLLVCSIDLQNGLDQNPVARQMRHSLLGYMTSQRFKPAIELTAEQVRGLIAPKELNNPAQDNALGSQRSQSTPTP